VPALRRFSEWLFRTGPDFGKPPIPAFLFLDTRFELIPAPLQLRSFCFLGSALEPLGSLRECSRSLWEQ